MTVSSSNLSGASSSGSQPQQSLASGDIGAVVGAHGNLCTSMGRRPEKDRLMAAVATVLLGKRPQLSRRSCKRSGFSCRM